LRPPLGGRTRLVIIIIIIIIYGQCFDNDGSLKVIGNNTIQWVT